MTYVFIGSQRETMQYFEHFAYCDSKSFSWNVETMGFLVDGVGIYFNTSLQYSCPIPYNQGKLILIPVVVSHCAVMIAITS